jgi:hypothetical protein
MSTFCGRCLSGDMSRGVHPGGASTSQVLLGSYLVFIIFAIAWLHRDLLMAAVGRDLYHLGWL